MKRGAKYIRSGRVQLVLSYLAEAGMGVAAGALSMFAIYASHDAGIGPRSKRALRGIRREHAKIVQGIREKRLWNATLWRMRREGLVTQEDERYRMTDKGAGMLAVYRARVLPDPKRYDATPSESVTIVGFDVPERERKKRDWLREALESMGFELVQKSVWAGTVGVSEEFVDDLERLKLTKYVSIFGVTKRGMLRMESGGKKKEKSKRVS